VGLRLPGQEFNDGSIPPGKPTDSNPWVPSHVEVPKFHAQSTRSDLARIASARQAFTIVEMLTTIAVLIIVLGLMVSLARHVRMASANQLTKEILSRLDAAMTTYISRNNGEIPNIPPIMGDNIEPPSEAVLARTAEKNNIAFVRALQIQGLLAGQFGDLSIAYFDEVRVRDAWGSPIVFMPKMHPAVGMGPKGWFFFSAGPDREFLTRADNLYSYDQPAGQP
jgi:type II secretory pathway pseudopilin PulG